MKVWIDKNYKVAYPEIEGEIKDIGYPCFADTKYDGELNFVVIDNGQVEMLNKDKYGKHRLSFPILDEIKQVGFPNNVVVVGELYIGKDIYEFLRNRNNDELKFAIFTFWLFRKIGFGYYPSDKKTFQEHRADLEKLFKGRTFKHIHLSECSMVNDFKGLERAKQQAINRAGIHRPEGIIAKNPNSLWIDGQTRLWTKLKKEKNADLVIIGWGRKAKILSLLLGYKDNGRWKPLCNCGSGMKHNERLKIKAFLETMRLPNNEQIDKYNVLIKPSLVVEITFQEIITNNGRTTLRHPIFKRIRADKDIDDITIDSIDK